jgi:hypothetical protein
LREKIVNLMVASEPATSTRAGSSRWRMFLGPNRRGTLIAAGIAVLAVMVAAYQVKEYLFPGLLGGSRSGVIAATKLPIRSRWRWSRRTRIAPSCPIIISSQAMIWRS